MHNCKDFELVYRIKKMNILFVTIGFPNKPGEQNIYSALMKEFRDLGHNVFVITALERRHGGKTAVSLENGITIARIKTLMNEKKPKLTKKIKINKKARSNQSSFMILMGLKVAGCT